VLNENKEAAAPKHTHHEKKHLEAQVPKNKQTPNQQMKKTGPATPIQKAATQQKQAENTNSPTQLAPKAYSGVPTPFIKEANRNFMSTHSHLHEANLIASTTSPRSNTPFEKMILFLDLQINHTFPSTPCKIYSKYKNMSKFGNDDIANFLHQISVMSFLSYSYRL
jgi:hypothetical protein